MKTKKHIWEAVLIAGLLLLSACGNDTADDKNLINRADGSISPGTHSEYHDGDYSAHSATYDAGGRGQTITVSVREGIITRVVYTERDTEGNDLAATALSSKAAKSKKYQTRGDVYQALENQLIRTQKASGVKSISVASGISGNFKKLAAAALAGSRKNKNAGVNVSVNLHKNGTLTFSP